MLLSEINCARHSSHFYLSTCDLVNKNSLYNFSGVPRIQNIYLELSANDNAIMNDSFPNFCEDVENRTEAFLLLFSLRLTKPWVFLREPSLKIVNSNSGFCLKLVLSKEEDIYLFLLSLLTENPKELVMQKLLADLITKQTTSTNTSHQKVFALSTNLFSKSFFALEDFLKKNNFDPRLEKCKLRLRFVLETYVSNLDKCYYSESFIRNIPLFWMSC